MEPHVLALSADGSPREVLRDGELTISVFRVRHTPVEPAVGYRFDYKGRSLVISGDTAKDARLIRAAQGADLLAHEAQNQELVAQMRDAATALERSRVAKIWRTFPAITPVLWKRLKRPTRPTWRSCCCTT